MKRAPAPQADRAALLHTVGWVLLAIVGVAILLFGVVAAAIPSANEPPFLRSIGVASLGMGLFGLAITIVPYRRGERWAWFTLWYYPAFWSAHFAGGLPPGKEHVHQLVFIVLSLAGLLLSARMFFSPRY